MAESFIYTIYAEETKGSTKIDGSASDIDHSHTNTRLAKRHETFAYLAKNGSKWPYTRIRILPI